MKYGGRKLDREKKGFLQKKREEHLHPFISIRKKVKRKER
jgi:hypothetical protein